MKKLAEYLQRMQKHQGTDLFVSDGRIPCMRIGGQLFQSGEEPATAEFFRDFFAEYLPPGIEARLMAEREVDIGMSLDDSSRFRLNLYLQRGKMSMVARRVPLGDLDWKTLRIPETLKRLTALPRGLVLITGATGSGKSTTMAAILNEINGSSSRHIVTIEDPIEFLHRDRSSIVSQREVGSDTLGFLPALRAALRQNPDVIFIGEMRDAETVLTALQAALTGHLVFATVHTQDVLTTMERILGLFPEQERFRAAMDLAASLEAVVSQRLLPGAKGGLVAAFEIFFKTPFAEKLVAQRRFAEVEEVMQLGEVDGMVTFARALADLVRQGLVTKDAGLAAATNRDELALILQGMETGIATFKEHGTGDAAAPLSMRDLLTEAVSRGASDLILTVNSRPQLRLGGILTPMAQQPILTAELTRRLLLSVLSASHRARFEEEKEVDFALSVADHIEDAPSVIGNVRFRVNGFYQRGTVGAVLRQIPQEIPPPETLRLPEPVRKLAYEQQGLVLVTGPTGSGKSTTLASLIDEINRTQACHIITVEDPIEFVHSNHKSLVEQREVGADTRDFASALKHALREDPDVILVGEMRDLETIMAALTAAETGHLVFATLHTNDAAQSIDRIVDVFPADRQEQIRVQLAASLIGVVSQRLLPKKDAPGKRVAAFEVLMATTAVRKQIREHQTHLIKGTIENSRKFGMQTMEASLEDLFVGGMISAAVYKEVTSGFGGLA